MATHEVLNQPPPFGDRNAFSDDTALVEALHREGGGWAQDELIEVGRAGGSVDFRELGRLANENPPVLRTHDRYGNRVDEVDYHPAYHRLMGAAIENGLHASAWGDERVGAHVVRCAKVIAWSPVDYGHTCPISMTYSVVPVLAQAEGAAAWIQGLRSRRYDSRLIPASRKLGLTAGMAMTEKQGGSDVRANTTVAEPIGGNEYSITGHKWFCSAPMSDLFLVLAQAPGGLTCFLLPRFRPDGTRNSISIQRLKDKLGDRSNASSEVEYDGAWAQRIGDEGAGVRTIIEMVNRTRLDCSLGAAAQMRHGVVEAVHHTRNRMAFGRILTDQPLMKAVLADLILESEAATMAAMRLARAYDDISRGVDDGGFHRIATPVVKYWLTKRAPGHAAEALECLGGVGYVEETGLPRLFRQSPLNGVWEGSGNVISLDVVRAMRRSPEAVQSFFEELRIPAGRDTRYDVAVDALEKDLATGIEEPFARSAVERMAMTLQACLLLRHAPAFVSEAFISARLASGGSAYGTLPPGVDVDPIIDRALPA